MSRAFLVFGLKVKPSGLMSANFPSTTSPKPVASTAADLNCDGGISPADVVLMLQIFFLSVSAPC